MHFNGPRLIGYDQLPLSLSKPIACMLGGGKAPRLSEVHCDRDSVCVKTDTRDLGCRSQY